jgi:hypothetical protein
MTEAIVVGGVLPSVYNFIMSESMQSSPKINTPDRAPFDLGHQGDVDCTQIAARLAMSPTERLRLHESWRIWLKETLRNAALRRKDRGSPG